MSFGGLFESLESNEGAAKAVLYFLPRCLNGRDKDFEIGHPRRNGLAFVVWFGCGDERERDGEMVAEVGSDEVGFDGNRGGVEQVICL